jgi:hypothetical protein
MLLKHNVGYHMQSCLALTPILGHINTDYEILISSIKINFNIITQSTQGLQSGHFLSDFLLKFCTLTHICPLHLHQTRPTCFHHVTIYLDSTKFLIREMAMHITKFL